MTYKYFDKEDIHTLVKMFVYIVLVGMPFVLGSAYFTGELCK